MGDFFRGFVRTNHWRVEAKVSIDGRIWSEAAIPDISAGGLLLLTDKTFKEGASLWLDVYINPLLTGADVHLKNIKADVVSERGARGKQNAYAVKFTEITKDDQIRLDELVRLTVAKYSENVTLGSF